MLHRRVPLHLADQAGLVVLECLHKKAFSLESSYMSWLPSLSDTASSIEETLNLTDVDTAEVILKYAANVELEKKDKTVEKGKGTGRKYKGKTKSKEEQTPEETVPVMFGIPTGAQPEEYIKYRKCLYIETVRKYKEELVSVLSSPALDHLLCLLTQLYRRTIESNETGIFTLQLMLLTEFTHSFLVSSTSFNRNFKSHLGIQSIENRIGPTMLRSSLVEGRRLTNLALERVCTDSLLELVSRVATNLKYLNISNSHVTDRGLIDLVGIKYDLAGSRPRLHRSCKPSQNQKLVKNQNPRWTQMPGKGALNLMHIEATGLTRLDWHLNVVYKYVDYQQVPVDAGFVALLTFLPNLRVLKTEVGGRAVQAYIRGLLGNKKWAPSEPLALEVLFEAHPTPAIMECLARHCPNLVELQVDWFEYYTPHNTNREDWVPLLNKLPNLTHLRTSDIDHQTSNLRDTLPVIGSNLVNLHLQEIWFFRYSLTKQIKESCPNLEKFCLLMASNNLMGSVSHIQVERDVDLNMETSSRNNPKKLFSKLKELHLIGPLGYEFVRYTVHGCNHLKVLTLGIEWPDPAFCNVTPSSRKDLLGREFLDEVRGVNSLSELEEIHFFAQYRRGSTRLNKDFAIYVANEFKNLKHFGTFKYWNLEFDISEVIRTIRQNRPSISFDEDYGELRTPYRSLRTNLREDRSKIACSWLPIRSRSVSLIDQVTEIMVGPGIIWADDDEDDDDDPDNLSDEDGSLNSSDDEAFPENGPLQMGDFEPLYCCIQ